MNVFNINKFTALILIAFLIVLRSGLARTFTQEESEQADAQLNQENMYLTNSSKLNTKNPIDSVIPVIQEGIASAEGIFSDERWCIACSGSDLKLFDRKSGILFKELKNAPQHPRKIFISEEAGALVAFMWGGRRGDYMAIWDLEEKNQNPIYQEGVQFSEGQFYDDQNKSIVYSSIESNPNTQTNLKELTITRSVEGVRYTISQAKNLKRLNPITENVVFCENGVIPALSSLKDRNIFNAKTNNYAIGKVSLGFEKDNVILNPLEDQDEMLTDAPSWLKKRKTNSNITSLSLTTLKTGKTSHADLYSVSQFPKNEIDSVLPHTLKSGEDGYDPSKLHTAFGDSGEVIVNNKYIKSLQSNIAVSIVSFSSDDRAAGYINYGSYGFIYDIKSKSPLFLIEPRYEQLEKQAPNVISQDHKWYDPMTFAQLENGVKKAKQDRYRFWPKISQKENFLNFLKSSTAPKIELSTKGKWGDPDLPWIGKVKEFFYIKDSSRLIKLSQNYQIDKQWEWLGMVEDMAIDTARGIAIGLFPSTYGVFIKTYDLNKSQEILNIYADQRGAVFLTPSNEYAAHGNASSLIAFRKGLNVYPLEQFDLRLNRPDIVLDRLGAPKEAIETAKSLRDKRLKRMGVTEEMLKPDFHLPELQIVGEVLVTTPKDQLDLQIKATDDKYPLDHLRVYVNNVPVNGRDGEILRDQKTQSLEKTIPIKLASGRNKIQVSVLNGAGAESLYANAEVNCTAERPKPKLYAVALGVSQYDRPECCLKYAAKDATDLINKLKAKAGSSYSEVKPLLLTDKEVTKESTAKIKEFLAGATIDDTVLIFMAGHGLLDDKYDYYFGTSDIDPAKPSERGMPYEAIDTILAEVPSLKKALLMDTCHAGELDADEKKELAASDDKATPAAVDSSLIGKVAMRSIGTRGMTIKAVEGAKGKSDWYEKLQDMFVDLRRGSGATVISSSQGAEYAFESSEQSNGLFTYALMEALDGKATPNKDGQITISAIGDYVKKRVQDLTKGKQNPNLRGVNLEEDFTLGAAK
jgi:uncharacterized caspase-like protein